MVSNHLIITDSAKKDIDDAVSYIYYSLGNPSFAKELLDEFERTIYLLLDFPKIYQVVENELFKIADVRKANIKSYVMYYSYYEDKHLIKIWAFIYGKRNINQIVDRF